MSAYQYWIAMPWWLALIVAIALMVAAMFAILWMERWYMSAEKRLKIRERRKRREAMQFLRSTAKRDAYSEFHR